jgi:hypothetical protein
VHKGQLHTTSTTHQSRVPLKKKSQHFPHFRYLKAAAYEGKVILGTSLGFYQPHFLRIKMGYDGYESSTNLSTLIYLRQAALRRMSFAFSICACFMSFILPTKTVGGTSCFQNEILATCFLVVDSLCNAGMPGALSKKHQLKRIHRSVLFTP